jgi:hypothetical protein
MGRAKRPREGMGQFFLSTSASFPDPEFTYDILIGFIFQKL